MSRVWVTGAAGFSGRHLVRMLRGLESPPRIVGLDVGERPPEGVDVYERLDLTDPAAVRHLAAQTGPTHVVHLAGLVPPATEPEMWRSNVGTTLALLLGLAEARCAARVVSVGSAAEYAPGDGLILESQTPSPSSPYGRTKLAQSTVALSLGARLGLHVCVARTFNLIGPGLPVSLVAGALCRQVADPGTREIRVGNTTSRRDFVDVRDAVRAYWDVARLGAAGEVYNVATERATSVGDLLERLLEAAGRAVPVVSDPALRRRQEADCVVGSAARLRALSGWRPAFTLPDSLAAMLEAARSTT
jgi:GDP-4-dehydro-6-deoxy-D-mannose reductase